MDLSELLAFAVKNNASDIHLSSELPPMIRIDGEIRRIKVDALSSSQVQDMIQDIMSDLQRKEFEKSWEADFAFDIPNVARFRVNVFNQENGPAAAFRIIPTEVKSLDMIEAPPIFSNLASKSRGLILVTGPTGSGKSTTLAALIDFINTQKKGHIVTVEDPIEFIHKSRNCLINQREIGRHTKSFNHALRSALREDPDVLLVGELRDIETIRLALTAAETGHLVFGTLHTSSAAKTIDRIIDVFPAGEKDMVRTMISESLEGVIAQRLVKKLEGGRIAAYEIMVATMAVRNLIREAKVAQIYGAIQTGREFGMTTLDQSLSDLLRKGLIDISTAKSAASDPAKFK